MRKQILVFGTRPEFIKLLPLIWEIKKQGLDQDYYFLYTGQQHDLVPELFNRFAFIPDESIAFVNHKNSLPASFVYLVGEIQKSISRLKEKHEVTSIIGQGDTSSCVSAALCAYLNKIPFTHIEAGLRTDNLEHPWPEEYFRKIITLSSTLHLVPTNSARGNLLKEGVDPNNIHVTGNTIVDVIHYFKKETRMPAVSGKKDKILISCHRRENQEKNFDTLVHKVLQLARENRDYEFIWLAHPNQHNLPHKSIRLIAGEKNMVISPPLCFIDLYKTYERVKLIISDSGGVQEEAPSFNIPVIIIRERTERIESVQMGYSETVRDIENDLIPVFNKYIRLSVPEMKNPYGDGYAAAKIITHLQQTGLRSPHPSAS